MKDYKNKKLDFCLWIKNINRIQKKTWEFLLKLLNNTKSKELGICKLGYHQNYTQNKIGPTKGKVTSTNGYEHKQVKWNIEQTHGSSWVAERPTLQHISQILNQSEEIRTTHINTAINLEAKKKKINFNNKNRPLAKKRATYRQSFHQKKPSLYYRQLRKFSTIFYPEIEFQEVGVGEKITEKAMANVNKNNRESINGIKEQAREMRQVVASVAWQHSLF